jgi:hypothetical protein
MTKTCLRAALLPLLLTAACIGTSKSANPLSPTIAGPIAGVGISAPTILEPAVDARINTQTQPVTLRVGNATTTGVRPLTYRFEIATDPGFTNLAFADGGIPQGANGSTSRTLPSALAADRKYYWRARAEDGANTGDFSATSAFNIFTPIIFGAPLPLAPINGGTTNSSQPRFLIGNVSYSGPVGQITYYLEIATSSSFAALVATYQFFESPGQTDFTAPVSLAAGEYYWRVRAFYGEYTGPFSGGQPFRSPGVSGGGGGGGGGGNPGAPCGPPYPTTPLGILECQRTHYPSDWGPLDRISFLKASARDMNAAGVPGGPFGVLKKESGNNCGGYSCDIICVGEGTSQLQYDVLISEQIPTWGDPHGYPGIRIDVCEIQ